MLYLLCMPVAGQAAVVVLGARLGGSQGFVGFVCWTACAWGPESARAIAKVSRAIALERV
jgi:hypothetical protein